MPPWNIRHDQSQQSPELQRQQQQQQQQQQERLLVQALRSRLKEILHSLENTCRELGQEILEESHRKKLVYFEEQSRLLVAMCNEAHEKLRELSELPDDEDHMDGIEENASGEQPPALVRWLKRLDWALFSPPHTFSSVLALVITQLELPIVPHSQPARR